MATGEDEPQSVVGNSTHIHLLDFGGFGGGRQQELGGAVLLAPLGLPAEPVDGLATGRGEQPGARAVRQARGRPGTERGDDRLLEGVLGEVEVAEDTDQSGENLPRLPAEHVVEADPRRFCGRPVVWRARGGTYPGMSNTGRTSTVPVRALGICAATSMARSRSLTSTM